MAVHWDWYKAIPFMYCESFGCMGTGMLIFAIAFFLPVLFTLIGFSANRGNRLSSGLIYGGTNLMCMLVVLAAIYALNQINIARGYEAERQACAKYPQLCPKTYETQKLAPQQQ